MSRTYFGVVNLVSDCTCIEDWLAIWLVSLVPIAVLRTGQRIGTMQVSYSMAKCCVQVLSA